MRKSIGIGISIPVEILKRIDIDRGDISRSKYIITKLGIGNSKSSVRRNRIICDHSWSLHNLSRKELESDNG